MRRYLTPVLLVVLLSACRPPSSASSVDGPTSADSGREALADAGHRDLRARDVSADSPGDLPQTDQGSFGCDPACQALGLHLCVPQGNSGCMECVVNGHCKANPYAFGPHCVADLGVGQCLCASDQECASSPRGKRCDPATHRCSCSSDSECAAPLSVCAPSFGRVTSCSAPCTSDADCAASPFKKCDTVTKRCVQCTTSADCTSGVEPICDPVAGLCGQCASDADCKTSPVGRSCQQGRCGCTTDGHCSGDRLGGSQCVLPQGFCGCGADAHCAGNLFGPRCHHANLTCSCLADADCSGNGAYTSCALPYAFADFARCELPCVSDAQCLADHGAAGTTWALPFCQGGKCSMCKSSADCQSPAAPLCNTATGRCVSCLTDAQCPATYGPRVCHAIKGCVECFADSHCQPPEADHDGAICRLASFICGCFLDADCKGNRHGPYCFAAYHECSCTSDQDCTVPPYTTCKKPYAWANHMRCAEP